MTERERWIVYPLLFLALGASLRDKLFGRTTSRSIVCEELVVVDEQPLGRGTEEIAKIGHTERNNGAPSSGFMAIKGQLIVDGAISARHLEVQGRPLVPFQIFPGMPLPDLLRAMQAAESNARSAAPPPKPLAEPAENP